MVTMNPCNAFLPWAVEPQHLNKNQRDFGLVLLAKPRNLEAVVFCSGKQAFSMRCCNSFLQAAVEYFRLCQPDLPDGPAQGKAKRWHPLRVGSSFRFHFVATHYLEFRGISWFCPTPDGVFKKSKNLELHYLLQALPALHLVEPCMSLGSF